MDRWVTMLVCLMSAVTDLIEATPEEDVMRRDIFDRPPIFKWCNGRVALLGDSAHAMQPNLGQGGCMAIEDAFQLSVDLKEEMENSKKRAEEPNIDSVLSEYFRKRLLRASAIHGMAGMAAFMASTYKAYLGEGLGPLEWITKFKIPHPGRVSGQVILKLTMPAVLDWVLGGYQDVLKRAGRVPFCRIGDKPLGFEESDFPLFMKDDQALLRAAHADWSLSSPSGKQGSDIELSETSITYLIAKEDGELRLGKDARNAVAEVEKLNGDFVLRSLTQELKVNGKSLDASSFLNPEDEISFGTSSQSWTVKLRHKSLAQSDHGKYDRRRASDSRVSELSLSS